MTRNQLFILAGVIATFVVMVLFPIAVIPLVLGAIIAGLYYYRSKIASWLKSFESENDTDASDPSPQGDLTDEPDNKDKVVKPSIRKRPWIYWAVTIPWLVAMFLFVMFGFFWGDNITNTTSFSEAGFARQAMIMLPVIWILLSIKIVRFDQTAGITSLGYAVLEPGSGPKLYAQGLISLFTYPRNSLQEQFPGDPEIVFKGDDSLPLPPGMKRALRVTTGAPSKESRDDVSDESSILNIQVTVGIFFYLRVEINEALVFALRYGTPDEFWRQIRDTGERVITNEFSRTRGAAELIENLGEIMRKLNDRFVEIAEAGGVKVIESGINSPDLSHTLATALRDLGVARSQAMQAQVKLEKEGVGRASAERAYIDQINEALAKADDATIAAYVGSRVLSDKTTVLGTEGLTQAMGLLKVLTAKEGS